MFRGVANVGEDQGRLAKTWLMTEKNRPAELVRLSSEFVFVTPRPCLATCHAVGCRTSGEKKAKHCRANVSEDWINSNLAYQGARYKVSRCGRILFECSATSVFLCAY